MRWKRVAMEAACWGMCGGGIAVSGAGGLVVLRRLHELNVKIGVLRIFSWGELWLVEVRQLSNNSPVSVFV